MASDDFGGNDASAEVAFERELIASAAADHVAEEAVSAAWSRFSVALGATATLAGAGATRPRPAAELAAQSRATLGWISLGAVGGGLFTAALFGVLGARGGPIPRVVASVPAPVSAIDATERADAGSALGASPAGRNGVTPRADTGERMEVPSASERAPQSDASSSAKPMRRHAAPARGSGVVRTQGTAAPADTSTSLAAEIALLDAARRARETGDFDRALALLDRYHREHPHGELRRESDVLKLETLVERGDREEATRLGRHFLETFPDDPHVAHVRTLAQ
jgi:hypothetical protein